MKFSKNDEREFMQNALKQAYGFKQFREVLGTKLTADSTDNEGHANHPNRIYAYSEIHWFLIGLGMILTIWLVCVVISSLTTPNVWGNPVKFSTFLKLLLGVLGPIILIYSVYFLDDDKPAFEKDGHRNEKKPTQASMQNKFSDVSDLFFNNDTILNVVLDKSVIADWQVKLNFLKEIGRQKEVVKIFTDNPRFMALVKTLDKAAGKRKTETFITLDHDDLYKSTSQTEYEVDVTKLKDYPQIATEIKCELHEIEQKVENEILKPDLNAIFAYIMQSDNPDLVSYLPIMIREKYANRLLENVLKK